VYTFTFTLCVVYSVRFDKCVHDLFSTTKYHIEAGRWWLTPVILTTQEADIRRIEVLSQPQQIVCKTVLKIPNTKRAGGGTQVVASMRL
jgi:hypothetical protein